MKIIIFFSCLFLSVSSVAEKSLRERAEEIGQLEKKYNEQREKYRNFRFNSISIKDSGVSGQYARELNQHLVETLNSRCPKSKSIAKENPDIFFYVNVDSTGKMELHEAIVKRGKNSVDEIKSCLMYNNQFKPPPEELIKGYKEVRLHFFTRLKKKN